MEMKNICYFRFLILMYIWMLLCCSFSVSAKDPSGAEFIVKAVIPENQTDRNHTYFDLNMKASQNQTIGVEIWNLTDQEISIETHIHSATTNRNGVIEYGERDVVPDASLVFQMKGIITCDSLVTVPANGKTVFKLQIQMPEKEYEGILAGGITFQLAENEIAEEAGSAGGYAIQNTYSYVIGIVLREDEKELQPELVLNDVFYNGETEMPELSVNIRNIKAAYVNDLGVKARIVRKETAKTLHQTTEEHMRMAPNSNFDFPIDLNGKSLSDGEFTLYINAATAEKEWNWEKDFTIISGIAHAEETPIYDKTTRYLWLFAFVPAVLLSGIILYRYRFIAPQSLI